MVDAEVDVLLFLTAGTVTVVGSLIQVHMFIIIVLRFIFYFGSAWLGGFTGSIVDNVTRMRV